jgi:hypothetical protein
MRTRNEFLKAKCQRCDIEFSTYRNWVERGRSKYCSRNCYWEGKRVLPRQCAECGIAFKPTQNKYSHTNKPAKYCSGKCYGKAKSRLVVESSNPNWQGGITQEQFRIRTSKEYKAWRTAVFERDKYACIQCGDNKGGNLEADHIKPFALHPELRLDVNNGRTLCSPCHKKTDTWGGKAVKLKRLNLS